MNITKLIKPYLRRTGITTMTCLLLIVPVVAVAEGLSGYAEYNYSLLDSNTTDTSGKSMTKNSSFNQRYSLTLDKNLFPTLRLSAVGSFEANAADSDTNGLSSNASSSRINTNSDLAYSNGVFNGGGGFSRRQEASKTNGSSSPTIFFDSYNGRFGWKPEDFPTLDLLYSNFNNYDEHRSAQDSTAASTTLSSRYKPHETVDMSYSANYSTLDSRLAGLESHSLNQSLRTAYSDTFFKERIAISSSYNIATQDTKTSNTGAGNSTGNGLLPLSQKTINQLFFASTALTDNAATTPTLGGPQNQNPVSTVSDTVISAVGLTPVRNNVGIKSNFSAVNIIRMPVTISAIVGHVISPQDFTDITGAFRLDNAATSRVKVYQSPAFDGTNWKLIPGATVTFGALSNPLTGALSDGFEIRLNETVPAATIIKVDIESVQSVTINAFIQKITLAAPEVYLQDASPLKPGQSKSSSQISGLYDMNLKARLLNIPAIFYDLGFNLDHTKSDSQAFTYRYSVVNGLSLNHRLSATTSTSVRLVREDAVDPVAGSRSSNSASISLSAQPLATLTHSVNYGFRQEADAGLTKRTHSANLSTSAELYRGISLSLTGGGSMASDTSGTDQKSLTVTSGLNLQPHKNLSINLSASDSRAWSSATGNPESFSSTQTGDLSVTFNPLPSIYLFGSYTINAQTSRKTQAARSIGGSWSPFRGGALLLNTSYRENIDNNGNKDSAMVQSLRWNIRSGWFLDVSYLISKDITTTRTTDTQVFNTALRLSF